MDVKRGVLQRLFHLYPGEERNAFLFASLGFLWAFGATCALKFADALFLLHVGAEHLPTAYTFTACGMLLIAALLLYAFHHLSPYQIYLTTLSIGIAFYLFISGVHLMGINESSTWFWYALKLAGFFLFSVLMTCYWTFIDQYYHLQDGKRLYSLFSSMIFLGAASTGLLMHSAALGLSGLLLLILSLLIISGTYVHKIKRSIPLLIHEESEHKGDVYEGGSPFKFLIKSIFASPFTLLLMTSNFLTYLLLVITEYNYMFTFQHVFASQDLSQAGEGTEAQLTLFLGQWLAIVSLGNLLFGLFVYSRLVRRFGISSLLMVTPFLLLFSFTGWSLSSSLLFPLIGFFVVEGTLYVIDDNNFNLLLNAVPSKLKYKIRVMIESFFEPIGILMSALLLSFFQNHSKLLGLILATFSLTVALSLRSRYLRALFFNLSENAIHFQRKIADWMSRMNDKEQKKAERRLLTILKSGDEAAQLFACEALLAFANPTLLKRLLNETFEMKSSTKIALLSLLEQSPFASHPLVLDALQEWIREGFDPQLKSAVYFTLAKQGLLHPEKVQGELKSADIQLQGAFIIALKKSLAYLPPTTAAYNRTLAAQELQTLLDSPEEEKLCMGLQILGVEGDMQDIDLLLSYLKHPSLKVARTAAKSLGEAQNLESLRQAPLLITLLAQLSDPEIRLACLKALTSLNDSSLVHDLIQATLHFRPNERRRAEEIIYKMGLRTVPTLLSMMQGTHLPDRCRLLAGRILGRLALPQLRAHLSETIHREIDRAYFYFYHHQTLPRSSSECDLTLLADVLLTNYHSVLDFIIQLLGVAGEVEEAEILSRSLKSRSPKIRSQVVEALEKTVDPPIFRLLQPLVDEIPQEEKMRAYLKRGGERLSLTALLDKMSESSSQMDQIMAAAMKYQLDLPNWRASLRKQMSRQDEIFHHFAYELLET